MAEKIVMRLQTPPDVNGNRKDINLITTSDEVIVNASSSDSKTLTEALNQMSTIKVQAAQPTYPCIWAKPID